MPNNKNHNKHSPKSPRTILVLEDEQPLAEVIKKELEIHGFLTVIARTAEQGLSYLKDVPDIAAIWLDHYLLGAEDGISFASKVRASSEKWSKIPIFVITNTGSPEKTDAYKALGVNKFYTKANHKLKDIISDIVDYLK